MPVTAPAAARSVTSPGWPAPTSACWCALGPVDARELYPVYAKAAEEDRIVFAHTGVNYATHRPIRNEHPLQLDQVACDFPRLRLAACHPAWPFVTEMTAVARRHSQVYVDFRRAGP